MAAENTIVLQCTCSDADQDAIYGKGKRLHNKRFVKGKEAGEAYCTVCSPGMRKLRLTSDKFPVPHHLRRPKDYAVKRSAEKEEKVKKPIAERK